MIGLYFSGTGNTEYAVRSFVRALDNTAAAAAITHPAVIESINLHDFVVFGYPVQFSDTPKIIKDFIANNPAIFINKKIFIIATMGMWSGDGAGVIARALKKHGAKIVGGLHIKMPDSIADEKAFAKQNHEKIIAAADEQIENAVKRFKAGKPTKHGLSVFSRIGGLLVQRLWFGGKTQKYHSMPTVNTRECIGCGVCAKQCPTNNLKLRDGKITHGGKCTLCYRCVNVCPQKALTIMGKKVYKQHILKNTNE